jgi:hypothetical protein
MRLIASILCLLVAFASLDAKACEVTYVTNVVTAPPQPVPYLQVMVYQAPAYTVMVPVVIQPQTVVEQRVVWGYPYQAVTVPVNQYHHWGYNKRCLPIYKY